MLVGWLIICNGEVAELWNAWIEFAQHVETGLSFLIQMCLAIFLCPLTRMTHCQTFGVCVCIAKASLHICWFLYRPLWISQPPIISSVCGVCVLKREHHCMFAGYCVGHFNHRFFVLFLAWLWLGVLYCTYLNSLYVWTGENSHFKEYHPVTLIVCLQSLRMCLCPPCSSLSSHFSSSCLAWTCLGPR